MSINGFINATTDLYHTVFTPVEDTCINFNIFLNELFSNFTKANVENIDALSDILRIVRKFLVTGTTHPSKKERFLMTE